MGEALWDRVKSQIKSDIPQNSFSLWISPLNFLEKNGDTLILGCPNKFSKRWVIENYLGIIREKLHGDGGSRLQVDFRVEPLSKSSPVPRDESDSWQLRIPNMPSAGGPRLNSDFVFERFVVGDCNEFAYSASKALCHGGRGNYRSLLMLADTGLGKSHLAQAVGNAVMTQYPERRVRYMTAEDFANEMIFSLKNDKIDEFKSRYRKSCDILLLEEVHFLANKKKIQMELGYTLDALANGSKKVVFTSSIPPKNIPGMSGELSSRLTSGLVTTISGPDFETRVNILRKKASEQGLVLGDGIVHFLADRLKRDVRQMECSLRCLKAKSELLNARIDVDLVKEVLNSLSAEENSISIRLILDMICKYYKVDPDMICSKSRKKIYSYPRNIFMYLCRRHTDETLETIGSFINRSHSTVLYASELVEHQMKTQGRLKRQLDFFNRRLEEKRGC